jgi:hypothetical protein
MRGGQRGGQRGLGGVRVCDVGGKSDDDDRGGKRRVVGGEGCVCLVKRVGYVDTLPLLTVWEGCGMRHAAWS